MENDTTEPPLRHGGSSADPSQETIEDARRWAGKTVTIGGIGGNICVGPSIIPNTRKSEDGYYTVTTAFRRATLFTIEPVDESLYGRGLVAFRVRGGAPSGTTTPKYLTVSPYGDEVKNAAAEALARSTPLLPVHVADVVNYVADEATAEGNFEGSGYNYRSLSASDGPLTWLQMFELESHGLGRYGIRSRFGTYWRSQHWDKIVSQSPHCLGDERWRFTEN